MEGDNPIGDADALLESRWEVTPASGKNSDVTPPSLSEYALFVSGRLSVVNGVRGIHD